MLVQRVGLILVSLMVCLGLLGNVSVADQIIRDTLMRERIVVPNVHLRYWNIQNESETNDGKITKTTKFTQLIHPWAFVFPVNRYFTVDIETGYMHSSMDESSENGEEVPKINLSGCTDTKIRGVYAIFEDQFMLRFGLNIHNGKNEIKADQSELLGKFSESALGFGVDRLGEGLDFDIGTGFARKVGQFVLGGGISYLAKGSYEPFEDLSDLEFSPGNELRIVGGADLYLKKNLLRADLVYVRYGESSRADLGSFKSDGKLCAEFTCRSAVIKGRTTEQIFIRNTFARSEFPESVAFYRVGLSAEDLSYMKRSHGNQIDIRSLTHFQMRSAIGLKLILEGKHIDENEENIGGALVFGIGGGVTWRIIRRLRLDVIVKYLGGRMDDNIGSKKADLDGIAFTGSLRTEI